MTKRTLLAVLAGTAMIAACGPPPNRHVDMFGIGANASGAATTNNDFTPEQALGQPDHDYGIGCSDDPRAWAPASADPLTTDPLQWIEITYPRYVYISTIKIYESYNPGAIVEVDAEASDSSVPPLMLFSDAAGDGPAGCGAFVIDINQGFTADMYNRVVVYLDATLTGDTNGVNGYLDDYNEIDAIEVIGDK